MFVNHRERGGKRHKDRGAETRCMTFGFSVKTHQSARDHGQQKADDDIGPSGKQRHLHQTAPGRTGPPPRSIVRAVMRSR